MNIQEAGNLSASKEAAEQQRNLCLNLCEEPDLRLGRPKQRDHRYRWKDRYRCPLGGFVPNFDNRQLMRRRVVSVSTVREAFFVACKTFVAVIRTFLSIGGIHESGVNLV